MNTNFWGVYYHGILLLSGTVFNDLFGMNSVIRFVVSGKAVYVYSLSEVETINFNSIDSVYLNKSDVQLINNENTSLHRML